MTSDDRRATALRWMATEPDDDIREELQALIDGDPNELGERFADRLQFGTAGLRAAVGAGPMRMNRLVVQQAAAGVAQYLLQTDPHARRRGVVIGFDARRKSDVFASDTARVMAAAGIPARLFDQRVATPVLAWSITELDLAAGIVVTASHNPPADNGYKVYLGDGAQIAPTPRCGYLGLHRRRRSDCGADVGARRSAHQQRRRRSRRRISGGDPVGTPAPDVAGVPVAYSAMHGVGGSTLVRAFEAAGFEAPHLVAEQFEPDGSFPTVSFPNPEEPGAMDLLIELAQRVDARLAIANDPDADRLAVAIPQPDGSWRRLGGDEIGWLFADYLLAIDDDPDRLVVTTLVSSSLLGKMAIEHGVHSAETFTGFKWIARAVLDRPDLRFVFGYEQALGYLVARQPLDKDGISAAVLFAEIAAVSVAEGRTMQGRLDDIAARYGRHLLADAAVRMSPVQAAAKVAALRADPPTEIGGRAVVSTEQYPEADLLRFELDGGVRVQIRPSGTEPKVKLYGEAVDEDPAPFVEALATLLG